MTTNQSNRNKTCKEYKNNLGKLKPCKNCGMPTMINSSKKLCSICIVEKHKKYKHFKNKPLSDNKDLHL